MKFNDFIVSEEKVRLDPKCWTGKKIGNPKTKMKGGVRVNNCVPAESVEEAANPAQQAAIAIAKKKKAGVEESAPPGAKAERMVKHIKKGVNEGTQRVDSLVTDALKIMRGSEASDAVAALKTVLGDREYNSRRGYYNFYVRQLLDMSGQQGVAEVFANPGSGSTGTARGAKRIATTVRKALAKHPETPEQIAARKDFEARIDARRAEKREQGVAEGSKEKTPGIALSKAYKKDFDNKKPGQDRAETALTGTYSKTGKPGGELKKQGVAEAATPASVSKVLRLIQRHHSDWFDTYGMGEVEDAVVDMAEMGQFRGTSAAVALKLVGDELESMYGQQGVAEAKAKTQKKDVVGFRSEAQFKTWKQYAQKEGYEIREAGNLPGSYAAFDDNGKRVGYFYNEFDLPNGYYYVGELITSVEQGVAEGYGRNSQAYQDDGGANDERHDLDPSDWYIVKDGKMYKTSVYPNQVQQAIAQGYSRTRDEAKAKADQQGVAEDYNPEYDDEAGMVENNRATLDRAVEGLDDLINSGDNLPEWCQEKIAVAKSMLVGVWDYMYSEEASDEVDPEVDEMFEAMDQLALEMAQKKGVSVDLVWETFEAMDDHMLYETAAWRRKEGKSAKGGLNAKGVASYRRENPGSKLQTAVTTKPSKLKPGSKAAKRRKSFCARMGGVKGPMKKPNGKPTRKALALRKWNC